MYSLIKYELKNRTAVITINRPEIYNALNSQTKHELTEAINAADRDPNVGCVLLTGSGRNAFSAGQDFHESKDLDPSDAKAWLNSFLPMYEAFRNFQKPIVCLINGSCAGSGLQLALLCDIRLATPNARLGLTEINVGFPTITGSTMLWDHVGQGLTVEMSLTGRLLDAEESLKHGLITKIVPWENVDEEVMAYCDDLAAKAPTAIRSMNKWFRMLTEDNFRRSFEFGADAHYIGYLSGEPKEYQEKFLAERAARHKKH